MRARNSNTSTLWLALATFAVVVGVPTPSNASEAASVKIVPLDHPTSAQTAAVQRGLRRSQDYKMEGSAECMRTQQQCYDLATADFNDDGRPDLLAYYRGNCGTVGCGGAIVMAAPGGYVHDAIELPVFNAMDVLAGKHHGMHDVQFDVGPRWAWTGSKYQITRRAR